MTVMTFHACLSLPRLKQDQEKFSVLQSKNSTGPETRTSLFLLIRTAKNSSVHAPVILSKICQLNIISYLIQNPPPVLNLASEF